MSNNPKKKHGNRSRVSRSNLQKGIERYHLRRNPSIGSVALYNAGFNDATIALMMLASWLITREELGRWPENVDEYAENWKMSKSAAYLELRRFKKAFPGFDGPTEFCVAHKIRIPQVARRDSDPTMIIDWLNGLKAPRTLLGGA